MTAENNLQELDARRTLCPIPVIKTQNAIRVLDQGALLKVWCTDPGALNDIPAWCRINGHEVVDKGEEGQAYFVLIRVGEQSDALF